jgi:23S rRNA (guanosine2251-2'-O)-methyltransferase
MDYLYGRNPVLESLRARRRSPRQLYLAQGGDLQSVATLARQARFPFEWVDRQRLQQLVGHGHHQGVVLETSDYPYVDLDDLLTDAHSAGRPALYLALDLLQDPQNVGSLLRTAEAVGVDGVILQRRRAVGITPAVVNSSSGATEHLRVAQVANLPQALRALQAADVWLYGLDTEPGATPIQDADFSRAVALVVGGESGGLRRLVRDLCDFRIRLPMRGAIESLNAAVAGSISLYAVWQARGFR